MKPAQERNAVLHWIIGILELLVCVGVVVTAILYIFSIWDNALYLFVPLMALNLLFSAYGQWDSHRRLAILQICAGVIILLILGIGFLLT